MPIVPIILSGGAGTRLWPVSRPERPKQLLPLLGAETMLATTAARVRDRGMFAAPTVVAGARHAAQVASEMTLAGAPDAALILEPAGRNTAPAIALAALASPADALLLVMPSDHLIADVPAFHGAVAAGAPLASQGWLVTFGLLPTHPETGFGYIERGEPLADGVDRVARFVEKPDADTAAAYLSSGRFLWNGGIFLFRADAMLAALARHAPDVLAAAERAMAAAAREGRVVRPDADAFAASPSVAIDVAVMERHDRIAVVPVSMGWSDVGSWDALYEVADRDAEGNALGAGDRAIDGSGLLVRAEGLDVTCVGVSDLIVVAAAGKLLIMPRGSSQRVREAVTARP